MSARAAQGEVRASPIVRAAIYAVLIVFAVYYLLPLFVMLVNSVKKLEVTTWESP